MRQAYRASILHFIADPDVVEADESYQYWNDGILLVEDGHVVQVGEAETLLSALPDSQPVTAYPNCLITPGFVDTHIHYPQMEMIAAFGKQLLEWLNTYTFPLEAKFSDPAYAQEIANRFLDELLRCGTTTALVFGTVHKESVDAFFQAS
ncbi:MAG TPA: guanine deaminase, partial [Armatimonadetes bacterium]|nr:guanine deaminase [Armatimonadota bacterium]